MLVVDDSPDAADSLALMLNAFGFRAMAAVSHAAALATAEVPDIVVLEPRLRGRDGYGLAEVFRPRGARLVIALTTGGQPEDYDRSAATGADAHLVKPAAVGDMMKALAIFPRAWRFAAAVMIGCPGCNQILRR